MSLLLQTWIFPDSCLLTVAGVFALAFAFGFGAGVGCGSGGPGTPEADAGGSVEPGQPELGFKFPIMAGLRS